MYYCGFSYAEIQRLPVVYKRWFIERVSKEMNKGNTDDTTPTAGNPSRAAHHNTPDVRQMMNRQRSQVPAKLRRFT